MALNQVGKFLPEGVRALSDLLNMLSKAAETCNMSAKRAYGWGYIGFDLDEKRYWVGLNHEEPEKLRFLAYYPYPDESVTKAAEQRCILWGKEKWSGEEVYRLTLGDVELDSEPIHFFSRTKVSQLEWLEGFLHKHREIARSIKALDQLPIP